MQGNIEEDINPKFKWVQAEEQIESENGKNEDAALELPADNSREEEVRQFPMVYREADCLKK